MKHVLCLPPGSGCQLTYAVAAAITAGCQESRCFKSWPAVVTLNTHKCTCRNSCLHICIECMWLLVCVKIWGFKVMVSKHIYQCVGCMLGHSDYEHMHSPQMCAFRVVPGRGIHRVYACILCMIEHQPYHVPLTFWWEAVLYSHWQQHHKADGARAACSSGHIPSTQVPRCFSQGGILTFSTQICFGWNVMSSPEGLCKFQ